MNLKEIYEQSRANLHSCIFCYPIEGLKIFEEGEIVAVADTFPLKPGHLILASKRHFGCMGDLPDENLADLDRALKRISANSSSTFSLYEHGKAGSCHTVGKNRFCEHFHLHVLLDSEPSDTNVLLEVEERYPIYHTAPSFNDVKNLYEKFGEYLYLKIGDKAVFVPAIDQEVPSHYLRTEFSKSYNCANRADWHAIDDYPSFETSYIKLSTKLGEALIYDLPR